MSIFGKSVPPFYERKLSIVHTPIDFFKEG